MFQVEFKNKKNNRFWNSLIWVRLLRKAFQVFRKFDSLLIFIIYLFFFLELDSLTAFYILYRTSVTKLKLMFKCWDRFQIPSISELGISV